MLTYAKSTYREIIDDIVSDLGEDTVFAGSRENEAIQSWIFFAEEAICKDFSIKEQYTLGLLSGVTEYQFRDRPPISSVSSGTPIVIGSEAHGLLTGDIVRIIEVVGNEAANGTRTITKLNDDSFSLQDADGNDVAASGDYVRGGRFWKTDEIPTHLRDVLAIRRSVDGEITNPTVTDMQQLLAQESADSITWDIFSTAGSPSSSAAWVKEGVKYLRVYPPPESDHDVDLYGTMLVVPRHYQRDSLTSKMHLPSEYDELIKLYVKSKLFESSDQKRSISYLAMFNAQMKHDKERRPIHTIMRIVYK